jgi:DNA topoisomerase-1
MRYGELNVSLPRGKDPLTVSIDDCIALIEGFKSKGGSAPVIKEFEGSGISVINGHYGPYLKKDGANYRLPKGVDAASISEEDCLKIINESGPTKPGRGRRFKKQ